MPPVGGDISDGSNGSSAGTEAISSTVGETASLPRPSLPASGGVYVWFERCDRLYLQPTFGNRRRHLVAPRTVPRAARGEDLVRRPHSLREEPPELEMSAVRLEQHSLRPQ